MCVWWPEDSLGCPSSGTFYLLLETVSLNDLAVSKPQCPTISDPLVLGLLTHAWIFSVHFMDPNSGSYVGEASALPSNHPPALSLFSLVKYMLCSGNSVVKVKGL